MQPPGVGKETQGPLGGDFGVDLAQGARRSIAGIGIGLLACRLGRGVQGGEFLMPQIDLAADFDDVRPTRTRQPLGDVRNGPEVFGDVFSHPAIAPGRPLNQNAFFVTN